MRQAVAVDVIKAEDKKAVGAGKNAKSAWKAQKAKICYSNGGRKVSALPISVFPSL
jgi:hypothetical protein